MVWQIDKNIMWSVIKHLLDILTHVKILNNLNHLYIEHGVCVCVYNVLRWLWILILFIF